MDWPDAEKPVLQPGDDTFEFDAGSAFTSRVLRSSSHALQEPPLYLPVPESGPCAEWDNWLKSPVFKQLPQDRQYFPGSPDRSGYHILLSARIRPAQTTPTEEAADLYYLPCKKEDWEKLVRLVPFHNAISDNIGRGKSFSTCLATEHNGENVEMYTAVMSREWPENIAISSTYFQSSRFTVAIIYGCSDVKDRDDGKPSVMDRIQSLLDRSPEARGHPLLLPRIFAELQRDRVESLVLDIETQLDELNSDLRINVRLQADDKNVPTSRQLDWEMSRRLGRFRVKVKRVEEEARMSRENLHKMISHIKDSTESGFWLGRNPPDAGTRSFSQEHEALFKKNTKRFKDRFEDICKELDAMMVRCRTGFEEVTYARELFMAELARQEAEHSKKEAEQTSRQTRMSTVIAFVAMLYLPTTLVATIFAMPVFDFSHRWMDEKFRYMPEDSSDGPSNSNSSDTSVSQSAQAPHHDSPVFSAYFWWYLLVSVGLTVITLGLWYWKTRDYDENAKEKGEAHEKEALMHDEHREPKTDGSETSGTPSGNASGGGSLKALLRKLLLIHKQKQAADVEKATTDD
ncbi:hypothetical protein B0H67DRAFT_578003 [Lasiosphaeris hirsuta]|uniref:Uncharacterized protein n=1 Tax=Lasiosphaeris hirsuta TaxID=260670 RepID=A0AA40E3B6_9PEZI|nr:hypothetical protein B0H67DRAFT_578003 [Lasiosphaeris hirsuta]